jgi:[protein-PII] uridylyltransferase
MTKAATFPARGENLRPMPRPKRPGVLPDLIAELVSGPLRREQALDLLRSHLGRIQGRVQDAFESHELDGLPAARWLAALVDGLMSAIHAYALAMVPPRNAAEEAEAPFALVATGGYGRGVLAPFSDIDLLFLTDQQAGPRSQRMVEFILYLLWDLGLKVGHATRSIRDCMEEAGRDATVLTALVDARFLVGDRAVFDRFRERSTAPGRSAASARSSPPSGRSAPPARALRRQPLPGGAAREGGARGPARPPDPLLARPLRLRTGADAGAGGAGQPRRRPAVRPGGARHPPGLELPVDGALPPPLRRRPGEERLTFDLQPVVGARMGYAPRGRQDGVERFMKHLFLTVRDVTRLTRVLEPAIERAALGPPAVRRQGDARWRRRASRSPTASWWRRRRTATSRASPC